MDWRLEKFLSSKFESIYSQKTSMSPGNNSSLLFDDENLLQLMFRTLGNDLERTNCEKKVKRGKSNEESQQFKKAGNNFFASKGEIDNLRKALESYTQCIAFAHPKSESIALGYANRSAVLFNLNRPKECLEDIDRALKNNYPEKLNAKLYVRMAQCYDTLATNSYADAKIWLKKVPINDSSRKTLEQALKDRSSTKENDDIVDEECIVPQFKQNSDYPCASDAVQVTHSKQHGRGLFATRNIHVGEVVACEKIYFKFLDVPNFYSHCTHCMTFLLNGIPCDTCVNFVYCSEKCKTEAWVEYHQVECEVFDVAQQYEACNNVQWTQCIKLLIKICREAGGLSQLIERISDFGNFTGNNFLINFLIIGIVYFYMQSICVSDEQKTFVSKDWYQSSSLESVLCLMTHESTVKKSVLKEIIGTATRSLFLLATSTEFFGVQYKRNEVDDKDVLSSMAKNQDVVSIGKLLMALMLIVRYNSYTVSIKYKIKSYSYEF